MNRQVILDCETFPNFLLWGWCDMASKTYRALTEKNMPWIERQVREGPPDFLTFNGQHFDLPLLNYALDRYRQSSDLVREIQSVFAKTRSL